MEPVPTVSDGAKPLPRRVAFLWRRLTNPALVYRTAALSDQLIFSVTNFVLTLGVARLFSTTSFGIYGIALSLALFVQSMQRGLYIVPLALGRRDRVQRLRAARLGEHLIFLLAIEGGVMLLSVGAWALGMDRYVVQTLVTLVGCGAIFLQADFDRALLMKLRSPVAAAAASTMFFLIVVATVACGYLLKLGFFAFIALLCVLCLGKSLVVMAMIRSLPSIALGRLLLRRNLRLYGAAALSGASIYAGMTQLPVIILAAFHGPDEVAIFVAMRSLTQPLMVIIRSLDSGDKNHFVERSGGTYQGLRSVFWRIFLTYLGIGLGMTMAMVALAPTLTHLAFRGAFPLRADLIWGWCTFCTLMGLSMPTQSLTYVLQRQIWAMRWNIVSAVVALALAIMLSRPFGAIGTMTATVSGMAGLVLVGLFAGRDVTFGRTVGPIQLRTSR